MVSAKDLAEQGFTERGIAKDSNAAKMMSDADTTGDGKDVVSDLQSAGAKGENYTG